MNVTCGSVSNKAHVICLQWSLWASLIVRLNTWLFSDIWAKSGGSDSCVPSACRLTTWGIYYFCGSHSYSIVQRIQMMTRHKKTNSKEVYQFPDAAVGENWETETWTLLTWQTDKPNISFSFVLTFNSAHQTFQESDNPAGNKLHVCECASVPSIPSGVSIWTKAHWEWSRVLASTCRCQLAPESMSDQIFQFETGTSFNYSLLLMFSHSPGTNVIITTNLI